MSIMKIAHATASNRVTVAKVGIGRGIAQIKRNNAERVQRERFIRLARRILAQVAVGCGWR
ncbi:MAG: hypothetical protein M3A44_11500 [Gammaproteobacteria bacterium]